MSALKRPGIWDKGPNVIQGEPTSNSNEPGTQINNNQEKVITAKHLSDQDTKSLGDKDTLPQNSKESSMLGDKSIGILSDQEVIRQTSQDTNQLGVSAPKSRGVQASKIQEAEKLDVQTSKHLDAIPLDAQTPNQLEVEPLDANPSEQQVDETLKRLRDEPLKPLDAVPQNGEAPKKKAKSSTLVKKTYYIDHDLDGAIELMAVLQKGDQSDIVRKLLRSVIPEYYLTQWKAMSDHSK